MAALQGRQEVISSAFHLRNFDNIESSAVKGFFYIIDIGDLKSPGITPLIVVSLLDTT